MCCSTNANGLPQRSSQWLNGHQTRSDTDETRDPWSLSGKVPARNSSHYYFQHILYKISQRLNSTLALPIIVYRGWNYCRAAILTSNSKTCRIEEYSRKIIRSFLAINTQAYFFLWWWWKTTFWTQKDRQQLVRGLQTDHVYPPVGHRLQLTWKH